jgi:hypothetical protein
MTRRLRLLGAELEELIRRSAGLADADLVEAPRR